MSAYFNILYSIDVPYVTLYITDVHFIVPKFFVIVYSFVTLYYVDYYKPTLIYITRFREIDSPETVLSRLSTAALTL